MKRKINLASSFFCTTLLMSTSFATEAVPDIVIPSGETSAVLDEVSESYLKIINSCIDEYGFDPSMDLNVSETGLATSKLIDFDNNGTPELYLLIVTGAENLEGLPYGNKIIREEIWVYSDGPFLIWQNDNEHYPGGTAMRSNETSIISHGNTTLLMDYDMLTHNSGSHVEINLRSFRNISSYSQDNLSVNYISHAWMYDDFESDMVELTWQVNEDIWVENHSRESEIMDNITNPEYLLTYFSQDYDYQTVESLYMYNNALYWENSHCIEQLESGETGTQDYFGFPAIFDNESLYSSIKKDLGTEIGGEILLIFHVTDGLYYVVCEVSGKQYGCLVYEYLGDGQITFGIYEKSNSNMSQSYLNGLVSQFFNEPNIEFDYSVLPNFTTQEEFSQYLDEVLSHVRGKTLNEQGKQEIVLYIELVLAQMGAVNFSAEENQLHLESTTFSTAMTRMKSMETKFLEVLGKHQVELNQTPKKTLQVYTQNMDLSQSMNLLFHDSLLEFWEDLSLRVNISGTSYGVEVEDLPTLLEGTESFSVMLERLSSQSLLVEFFDEMGQRIDRINAPVVITLPADSSLDTAFLSYDGVEDNWGGQWDGQNKTISLSVPISGELTVKKSDLNISDIDHLTSEMQESIEFMVSKGYFYLYDHEFLSHNSMSRYAFAQALVGMFFALDRNLTTSFHDVPLDSNFYPYVASAQEKNLVTGFEDGRYGGDEMITHEQILSMIARTMFEVKGCPYPTATPLADEMNVVDWAKTAIEMCYEQGILLQEEDVPRDEEISRGRASLYLYRLFNMLYEPSPIPYSVEFVATEDVLGKIYEVSAMVTGGWAFLYAGIWAGLAERKKKR